MNIKKIILIFAAISIGIFSQQKVFAKDKVYTISVKGHVSGEINNQEDFTMLNASKYTLKKRYDFFTVENVRRYEKSSKGGSRLGSRVSTKSQKRTEIRIHCFDSDSAPEGAHNATKIKQAIDEKYAN